MCCPSIRNHEKNEYGYRNSMSNATARHAERERELAGGEGLLCVLCGGHRELGHIPGNGVLRSFVQAARCRSDGTADATGSPTFIRDGQEGVDVWQLDVVSALVHEPGWQDEWGQGGSDGSSSHGSMVRGRGMGSKDKASLAEAVSGGRTRQDRAGRAGTCGRERRVTGTPGVSVLDRC